MSQIKPAEIHQAYLCQFIFHFVYFKNIIISQNPILTKYTDKLQLHLKSDKLQLHLKTDKITTCSVSVGCSFTSYLSLYHILTIDLNIKVFLCYLMIGSIDFYIHFIIYHQTSLLTKQQKYFNFLETPCKSKILLD